MWASSAKNGEHWVLGVWYPHELPAAKQVGAAWWLSQAPASLWAAPTGCAANGNWNPQPRALLFPHGGRGSAKKPGLLSLFAPSWQDNSHPVWFCGLHSFLFFHLLLTQKAGSGSWKRSDKQKWSCSQGSGHFYSALTKNPTLAAAVAA